MLQTEEYNYDLTQFKNAEEFKNLLERHGLTEHVKVEKDTNREEKMWAFAWYNPEKNLVIETKHNPITGEFREQEETDLYKELDKDLPKGKCSYVAIEGEKEAVRELVEDFEESAENIKAGGKEARVTSVKKEIKQEIPYFHGYEVVEFHPQDPSRDGVKA